MVSHNSKEYRDSHKKEIAIQMRNYLRKKRNEILFLLGNKCVECNYTGLALQIDHVNENGCKERKRLGESTLNYYLTILKKIKEGSKEYQLLCANCNFIKRLTKENTRRVY